VVNLFLNDRSSIGQRQQQQQQAAATLRFV